MPALKLSRFDLRWSNRSLTLLFVVCFAVFAAWRWQPKAWLDARIQDMARQAGVGLQYRSLGFHGLALRVDGATVALPGTAAPVRVDRLTVRPAWLKLLTGHSAARLSLLWHGQAIHFSVALHGHEASVHIPDTRFPIAVLAPLWQRAMTLPVALIGNIRLHGDADISLADGRPLHGHVVLAWNDAGADMIGNRMALGSYRVQGKGADGRWRFTAAGGQQAVLRASGKLNALGADARAWAVQVHGQVSARPGSKLAGLMGAKPLHFELAGPVASPHWRVQ